MSEAEVRQLLDEFRANRREFVRRLLPLPPEVRTEPLTGGWSARDLIAHIAAWLDEANDRIPRLLAGAPSRPYDVNAFNAAAVARAQDWTAEQTLAAFRRAADRFEAIVGESDTADIADSEDALTWVRSAARDLMTEHYAEIDALVAAARARNAPTS
jgi:hypothetical protein